MPVVDLLAINSSNPVKNVGYIESDAVLYSDMYQNFSASGSANGPHEIPCCQLLTGGRYYGYEPLLQWNTSVIPPEAIIDDVQLSLYILVDTSPVAFNMEVYPWDFGDNISSLNDWVAPASLSGLTMLASFNESNLGGANYYQQWTVANRAAFIAAINRTGYTRLMMISSRLRTLTAPVSSAEYVSFQGDSPNYPKLSVAYHVPTFPRMSIAPATMPANPYRGR